MRYADSIVLASNKTNQKPDICRGHFDAVSLIRGEVFIFKGDLVWRLTQNYHIQDGYPVRIHQMFTGMPAYLQRIDAVYERPLDSAIVLFSGSFYVSIGQDYYDKQSESVRSIVLCLAQYERNEMIDSRTSADLFY